MNEDAVTRPGRERPRRLRRSAKLRELVAETRLSPDRLIVPHFVLPTAKGREEIASMPGIDRMGRDELVSQVGHDRDLGLSTVLLFGLPEEGGKDGKGTHAYSKDSAVPLAVEALKDAYGDSLVVITDVCLCAYTDHGHCGVLHDESVHNDLSLIPIARMAVAHASAGADIVAPSDMMDGRVAAIRDALDDAGHIDTAILSYAVKYASAYYGPFRDAADSAPGKGDRQSYQMDIRNSDEAIREAALDEAEGADMLMVKPALAFLDIIHRIKEMSALPLAAYNVSGEYSAVKAAAERGYLDEGRIVRENLLSMARAGADLIITYHARDAMREGWLS